MLETANQMYPTSQNFRETLGQSIWYRYVNQLFLEEGKSHVVELTFNYVRDEFLSRKNVLTSQVLELVKETLFSPVYLIIGLIRTYLKLRKNNC